jgi:glycosyltransferase involved in cell wall biosynthesis
MAKLSAIIITKNEADNIRACLESVNWADTYNCGLARIWHTKKSCPLTCNM